MTSAIAVLAGLVGFNVAVKVYSLMKMWGIKIDDMSEEEIIDTYNKLMEDKRLQKYMRYIGA